MKTTWDFVVQFYPNYYHCYEITRNDQLCQLINNEHERGSDADVLLIEEYDDDIENKQIKADYAESCKDIYEKAIEGYLKTLNILG